MIKIESCGFRKRLIFYYDVITDKLDLNIGGRMLTHHGPELQLWSLLWYLVQKEVMKLQMGYYLMQFKNWLKVSKQLFQDSGCVVKVYFANPKS